MNTDKIYKVTRSNGEYLMSAPLAVIASMFRLHPTAVDRIYREVGIEGKCELFFGISRTIMDLESIVVSENTLEVKSVAFGAIPKAVKNASEELLAKLATPEDTAKRPAHVNRAIIRQMEEELKIRGFGRYAELDGEGYVVWQEHGAHGRRATEVRLFTNRFFRVVSFEGVELENGSGVLQLRKALDSGEVR